MDLAKRRTNSNRAVTKNPARVVTYARKWGAAFRDEYVKLLFANRRESAFRNYPLPSDPSLHPALITPKFVFPLHEE